MPRRRQFFSSVRALLQGPVAPKRFLGAPFFRDCWIESRFPRVAFAAAIVIEALLIAFPPPIWNIAPPRRTLPQPDLQLRYYGPVKDLPIIVPLNAARGEAPKDQSSPGQEGFHPRQTIIAAPLHPTHPRQTLIQPAAPPEPPKFLPPLPNIVQIAAAPVLARPKLEINAQELAAAHPRQRTEQPVTSADAPQVDINEKQLGPLDIAATQNPAVAPALPVSPMSAPRKAQQKEVADAAAPEFENAGSGPASTFIALSATPAPVAPPGEPPAGNLSARIAVSPQGKADGGAGHNGAAGEHGIGGSGIGADDAGRHGPDDIFISGGNSGSKGSSTELSAGLKPGSPSPILPSRPAARPAIPRQEGNRSTDSAAKLVQGSSPEHLLGGKRIYTLNVNMPNLTSASGSWVLNFAEMDDPLSKAPPDSVAGIAIVAPVPVRKVDPKYPPELRAGHVEGEVVLYAIIRKDGSVDSIQLVRGVDSRLDANAMDALSQWKFQPAEKQGVPIDLEAVVHIPFRSRDVLY